MLMRRRCKKRKSEGGVLIKTFTGTDANKVICTVGNRTDLKHVVRIKNLRAYDTRVKCLAVISEPGVIAFVPPTSDDTNEKWTAEHILDNNETFTFPRVGILSLKPNSDEQKITIELEIDRLRPRSTKESARLQIFVSP
jgi:hypothetical protein